MRFPDNDCKQNHKKGNAEGAQPLQPELKGVQGAKSPAGGAGERCLGRRCRGQMKATVCRAPRKFFFSLFAAEGGEL